MPIVTLTSDWINSDYYIAFVKGKILSKCPDTTCIDITHTIQTHSIIQAAFILKNSFSEFPAGTIHIIAVNSESENNQHHVIVKAKGHYFIGNDNGIFGLMFEENPLEIFEINETDQNTSFPEYTIFAEVACMLLEGKEPENIGKPVKEIVRKTPILPAIDNNTINGSIIFIDSYRNAITNISRGLFEQIGKGKNFDILIQSNHYKVNKISDHYSDIPVGELLALFNSLQLLEIAINKGNVAELLNLSIGSVIRIKFYK